MRTLHTVLIVCLGTFMLAAVAMGQASKDGVITINGGRTTVYMKPPSPVVAPAQPPSADLVTIYSNLGTGSNVYNAIAGSGVLGRQVPGQPRPEWLANGFTPTADHTVTEIQVGVTYVSGDNEMVLSLNEDNGGVPGKVLHTWHFANLSAFGTCCTLQTARLKTGIPVKKDTLYWVLVRTSRQGVDTWDVWNNNISDFQGSFSNNTGQGWNQKSIQELGAFGVFGQ
ncbi:MAG: hypothetical protein LAN83_09435 [Acidobacteriia bacterium]|nr:hypothetical protein [Terriglobia bacterium]